MHGLSPSLSSHSSEPGHPAYADEENGGGGSSQSFLALPPVGAAAVSSSASGSSSQEQAGELTPGTVHRSRSEDAVLRELAGASSVPSSLPPPVILARADSLVTAAERKRREGERDENDLALSAMPTPAASPSAAMPFASPTAASASASSSVSSSAAAPTPAHAADPTRPLRASVEDSPDGKWSRYKKQLGSGTFKDVYLGVDTESGTEVAWNVVDLRKMSAKDRERITQETELLKTLRHPHIMAIHDVWQDAEQQKIVFITERSAYTLKQHIANLHPAKRTVIKKYSRQILTALEYLHSLSPPIIHRDLKCDNIFIAQNSDIVIGDFGLSIAKDAAISLVGTPGFLAPELFAEQYDEKVDIWSVLMHAACEGLAHSVSRVASPDRSCVLSLRCVCCCFCCCVVLCRSFGMAVFEMATNQFPYIECNGVVSVLLKRGFEGVKPDGLAQIADPQLREFILMCLQPVEKRPSAKQLLEQKVYDLFELPKVADKKGGVGAVASSIPATPSASDANAAAAAGGAAVSDLSHVNGASVSAHLPASDGLDVRIASAVPSASISHQSSEAATTSSILPAASQWRGDSSAASAGAAASSSVSASAGVAVQSASAPLNDSSSSGSSSSSSAASSSAASVAQKKAAAQAEASAALAAAKQEALRRRADVLIPKTAVAKTDSPAVVSIFLYARLKDDMQTLHAMMEQAVKSPSAPVAPEIPDLSRLLLIDIPSYEFTRDNYLAVATSLIRAREDLSQSATELENIDEQIQLEQLIACKIEECVREKYNKWSARTRTTLNSEIMTLLTSLGMNLSVAQKFIEQEVTYEDLFLLSDADLQEFIPKLGPRRRLQQYLESETRRKAAANNPHAGPHGVHASYASGSDHDDPPEPRKKPQRDSSSSSSSSSATNGNGHSKDRDPTRVKKSSTSSGAEDAPVKPKKKKLVDPAAAAAGADSAAATPAVDGEAPKPKVKSKRAVTATDESAAAAMPSADSAADRPKTLRVRDEATSTSSTGVTASAVAPSSTVDSPSKDRPKPREPRVEKTGPPTASSSVPAAASATAAAAAPSDAVIKKKTAKPAPPQPAASSDAATAVAGMHSPPPAAHAAVHSTATPPTQPAAMLPPPSITTAAPSPTVSPAPPKRAPVAAAPALTPSSTTSFDSSAPQPARKSSSVAPVGVASPVGNPAAALSTPSGSPITPHHSSRANTQSLPASLPSSSLSASGSASPAPPAASSTPSTGAKSSQRFFDQSGDHHMNALLSKIHHELQPPTAKAKQQQQQATITSDLLAAREQRDPLLNSPQPHRPGVGAGVGVSSSHAIGSSRQTIDALSSTSPSRSRRNSGSSPSAPTIALSMAALAAANANAAAAAAPSTTSATSAPHGSSRPTSPLLPLSTHYSTTVPAGAGVASTSLFSPTPNNQTRSQSHQSHPIIYPLGLGSSSLSSSTPLPAVLHAPEDYPAFSKADSRQPLHGPALTHNSNIISNTAYHHIAQQQTTHTSQHTATRTS